MSETNSDSTFDQESCVSNREDIHDIMASLGITSPELLAQDRFRVDRKLLENLLFGGDKNAASNLFLQIMQQTKTHIAWPSRLKLHAKSRKDPHIKILGRANDVKDAHEMVLTNLGTKGNRVNMKIDVSYTEHSHIIGKGGLTIKKVMESTDCHIHFPDSNRNNPMEKSNQVSIAGDVSNVEKARAKVRELTPLIFCFELPIILEALTLTANQITPYINNIQKTYDVQVTYRGRQKLNATLVVVKGSEWKVESVKEATKLLITHLCKSLADHVAVQMTLEISPHHHKVVLGKNNENLKSIMMHTRTQITFNDPNDPNIPTLKKSKVTITGAINDVYVARQQIIGSLPVLLMFDEPENSEAVASSKMEEVMKQCKVLITTRLKEKRNIVSVVIKGIERNIGDVYEAHKQLLNLNSPPFQIKIPPNYFIQPLINPLWNTVHNCSNITPVMINPIMGENWQHMPHCVYRQHMPHSDINYTYISEYPGFTSISSNTSSLSNSRTTSPVPEKKEIPDVKVPPGFTSAHKSQVDVQKLRLQALKAIHQKPNDSEVRVPNSIWSGYGFSDSSKEPSTFKEKTEYKDWTTNNIFNGNSHLNAWMSNKVDFITEDAFSTISSNKMKDVASILLSLGLEEYIRKFDMEEIDLMALKLLNEDDLKEIGVHSPAARLKILLCIAHMKLQEKQQKKSTAPGAERKSTNSLYNKDN